MVHPTSEILAAYASVQNTYLLTFQTLGGLGFLLGTLGMVTVVLRSVVERRREFALMLAVGFRKYRLVGMRVLERVLLLLVGVAIGSISSLVAVIPQLMSSQMEVGWGTSALVLVAMVLTGLTSCIIAARVSLRGNLLSALRSE